MKKLIIVALILLSKVWATNAQDANELTTDNPAAKNIISENNNEPVHFSLFTKNELLKFNNPGDPGEKTDYLQKSRNQKTGAWILLGAGVAGIFAGIAVQANKAPENTYALFTDEKTDNTGFVIIGAGACVAIGSIPLFAASSKNKRKASAELGIQKTGFGVPSNVSSHITGISLSFPIGK
jgi:hypothetical protein